MEEREREPPKGKRPSVADTSWQDALSQIFCLKVARQRDLVQQGCFKTTQGLWSKSRRQSLEAGNSIICEKLR